MPPRLRRRSSLFAILADIPESDPRALISYWHGFAEYSIAKSHWQTLESQHVHMNSQESLGFELEGRERQEGRVGRWIYEQIQIAFFGIFAAHGRPENSWPQGAVAGDNFPQLLSMSAKGF